MRVEQKISLGGQHNFCASEKDFQYLKNIWHSSVCILYSDTLQILSLLIRPSALADYKLVDWNQVLLFSITDTLKIQMSLTFYMVFSRQHRKLQSLT